jgi:hypothetical protein
MLIVSTAKEIRNKHTLSLFSPFLLANFKQTYYLNCSIRANILGSMKAAADRWTNAQGIARFNIPNLRIWPAVEAHVDFNELIVSDRARKWIPDLQTWATEGI